MIDIEALAAPAFLVGVGGTGLLADVRLNAAARACPALAGRLSVLRGGGALAGAIADCAAGTVAADVPLPAPARDGTACWRASLVAVADGDGRAEAVLGLCREEGRAGRERTPAGDHLSLALRAIHGAEWRYDVARGAYEGSDEIATLIGEDRPRPVAWEEWLGRVHPQDLAGFLQRPALKGTTEFRFHAADGRLRWARCSRVAVTDGAGEVEAVLGIMVDVTQERVRETAWAELATHDPLTGLLNRRGLRQEADRLQADPAAPPCLALFVVDLDSFKETNDAHGHAAGDAVLVEAARRLAALAGEAVSARLGGDEFVVVMPVSGEAEARELRARLQEAFRRPLAFRGRWLSVSATVGLACRAEALDVARLMEEADADLYARKRRGARATAAWCEIRPDEPAARPRPRIAVLTGAPTMDDLTNHIGVLAAG